MISKNRKREFSLNKNKLYQFTSTTDLNLEFSYFLQLTYDMMETLDETPKEDSETIQAVIQSYQNQVKHVVDKIVYTSVNHSVNNINNKAYNENLETCSQTSNVMMKPRWAFSRKLLALAGCDATRFDKTIISKYHCLVNGSGERSTYLNGMKHFELTEKHHENIVEFNELADNLKLPIELKVGEIIV